MAIATMGAAAHSVTAAGPPSVDDPRYELTAGLTNAQTAQLNMELLANLPKPAAVNGTNSDIAFTGNHAIVGNYSGFNIYDISDPAVPELRTSVFCPGSQNDVSVHGNLLFLSVEAASAKIDCTTTPAANAATRFRGIRIFDISDLDAPVHVGGVQTCRGSHTHTLVTDPDDATHLYIYNSGSAGVRAAAEPPGNCNLDGANSPDPSMWLVEVIEVPLAAPATASIVNRARLFIDPDTGAFNGLQNGPTQPSHPAGGGYSPSPNTNHCHDITAYPEIGLAAGACAGNGLLIDISDPANPTRIDAVADPNYSYWHSATFNNDGTKVVFTDEWGGGGGARCRPTDDLTWGADSIYDIVDTADGPRLEFAAYYKIPAAQKSQENCVAHNGSLVPIPGRDVMVQAWYQGGVSLWEFTDSAHPVEIGYFDRGPIHDTALVSGGLWSAYWYNGYVYGSELARGFDTYRLLASDLISANELAAAAMVDRPALNAQTQLRNSWPTTFLLARAYLDQAERDPAVDIDATAVGELLDEAEALIGSDATDPAIRDALEAALGAATDAGAALLAETLSNLLDIHVTLPDAPRDPAAAPDALSGDVALTWAEPESDGGDAVTAYRIEISDDGGDNWALVTDAEPSTGHVLTGLIREATYHARIAATNAIGTGAFSESLEFTVPAPPSVPDVPADVIAAAGDGAITVTWSAPDDGGAPITGYVVETKAAGLTSTVDTGTADTSYALTGLANDVEYSVRVAAVNGVGAGGYSAVVTATPSSDAEPEPTPTPTPPTTPQPTPSPTPTPDPDGDGDTGFVVINPTRALDTRIARPAAGSPATFVPDGSVVAAGTTVRIAVPDAVPDDATAVAITITSTDAETPGYVTAFPCDGSVPLASNTNPTPQHAIANTTVTAVVDGTICLYTLSPTHLVVDVNAYASAEGGFAQVEPTRLFDSRDGAGTPVGPTASVRVKPPTNTGSSVLTVTTTDAADPGFVTIRPCSRPFPPVSNVNPTPAHPTANLVIVPNTAGDWCVYSLTATHVIVDHIGTFDQVVAPVNSRLLDTRIGGDPVAAGATVEVELAGEGVHAINVTAVDPQSPGFITVYRCGDEQPLASNLNTADDHPVANLVLVPSGGAVCLYSLGVTDLIVDHVATIPPRD